MTARSEAEASLRAACVRALEAIQDGDTDEAAAFLEAALDEPVKRPYRCTICGAAFEWPGLLDAHDWHAHAEFEYDYPPDSEDEDELIVGGELDAARERDLDEDDGPA